VGTGGSPPPTSKGNRLDEIDAVGHALEIAESMYTVATLLEHDDRPVTVYRLRAELHRGRTRLALLLIHGMHTDVTVELVDNIMPWALSARDMLLVRQIFARLPWLDAAAAVPPAVVRLAGQRPDAATYRALAGLLVYLGLDDALRELTEMAMASDDPGVREVGEEYHPD